MTENGEANPWERLPGKAPFILLEDEDLVIDFNSGASDEHKLRLEIFPEPFLGRTDAPVVLLNLNPGFKPINLSQHSAPHFAQRSRENLLHTPTGFPFYLIDPALKAPVERTWWWDRKLGSLMDQFGTDGRSIVANTVLCVEFFPYHSKRFKHRRCPLPSQQYSFSLVRRAIKRRAITLVMRSEKLWLDAVPELASYAQRFTARSVQNPTISTKNFPDGFAAAIKAVRSSTFLNGAK